MKSPLSFSLLTFLLLGAGFLANLLAEAPNLSQIRSQTDLENLIHATGDATLKKALKENSTAILEAATRQPHVEAVIRTIEISPGKFEKINTTPEALKAALGTEVPLFDTIKLVDLTMPNVGPHGHRETDPYDAAFFEHLGNITSLESLHIIATKLGDDGIAPIARLTNLKSLRFTNNGKLSDVGLEQLAGLTNVESFAFVGTGMKGHAYAKFNGWTKLTRCSHRGSSIDDEGLRELCEHLPNLESLSLAHAKFTNAGAVHLTKLTKLKGLEMGTKNATTACLVHLKALPLEYLQLGDGLDAPDGIAACKAIPTLRRLTLTDCTKLKDDGLKLASDLHQLEQLEVGGLDLSETRLPMLEAFSFLKELKLIRRPQGYPPEIQNQIKALLPKVNVKFQ